MKETEKKGLDYFDNQIENGNANVLVMIGTLSEENEELKKDKEYLNKVNDEQTKKILDLSEEFKLTISKMEIITNELKDLAENRKVFIDWVFENYPEVADKYLEQGEIK